MISKIHHNSRNHPVFLWLSYGLLLLTIVCGSLMVTSSWARDTTKVVCVQK